MGRMDWKVSTKLTLNLGLRWDVDIPHKELNNQLSYWNPTAASPLQGASISANNCPACGNLLGAMTIVGTPGAQYGREQVPLQKKDFGPRFGLAYNPTPKIVVRAGVGIIFQPSAFQAAGTTGSPGNEGFSTQTNFNPSFTNQDNPPIATLYSPDAQAGGKLPAFCIQSVPHLRLSTGPSIHLRDQPEVRSGDRPGQNQLQNSYFDSDRNPYSIEWNGNVQFAMPFDVKLELGYLANKGVFLNRWRSGQAIRSAIDDHLGPVWLHSWRAHVQLPAIEIRLQTPLTE